MHNPHGFKTIEKEERSYLDPAVRIKILKNFLFHLVTIKYRNKVKDVCRVEYHIVIMAVQSTI